MRSRTKSFPLTKSVGMLRQLRSKNMPWRTSTALIATFLTVAMSVQLMSASPAAAATTLYAYATSTTTGLGSCPQTSTASQQCTLAEALSLVAAGGTVALASPGATSHYFGNWPLSTSGTSSSEPVTIEPASGVANPTLDGNNGSSTGCQTSSCAGTVLVVGSGVYAAIEGITVQDADATTTTDGGGIRNSGTLTVSGSTLSGNKGSPVAGGAIYNSGTLTVSGSTFSGNEVVADAGGAIYNSGTITLSDSTLSGNSAANGGAIYNANVAIVWASTFSGNSASEGGAIYTTSGMTELEAAADIFNGSCDQVGSWDDQGYNVGSDGTCLDSGTGDVNYGGSLTSLLNSLGNYGGPTETMPPLAGNPAIGVIPVSTSATLNGSPVQLCPTTDQRGATTPSGEACDAGAVQLATLYAYATSTTTGLGSCPQTSTASQQCTLAEALSLVAAGGTVALASPGATSHYFGNWPLSTSGTSSSEPVTIEPASGVANPTLDGNNGSSTGCQTSSCAGTVLVVGSGVYAAIEGITVQDADATTTTDGGGIRNSGTLTVSGSTLSGNKGSPVAGGAIYNSGTLTVSGSTFSGNEVVADAGGAIYNSGTITLSDSTLSGNSAANGGAIYNANVAIVWASTFSGNSASEGGAIYTTSGMTELEAAADIFNGSCDQVGSWDDQGYNVGSDGTCLDSGTGDVNYGGSLTSLLNSLGNYGGPTETMPPLAGNPAIGVIPVSTSATLNGSPVQLCPTTDQRGATTPSGEACDAGAVQLATSIVPDEAPVTGLVQVTISGAGFSGSTGFAFGSVASGSVTCSSSTSCTAIVPAAAGPGVITVSATSGSVSSPYFTYYSPGLLRVTTSPAVPSQITVNGSIADTWGLNWVKEPPGSHTVCFSAVQGFGTPPCQQVSVTSGQTTAVTGAFTQYGYIEVQTSPPLAGEVTVRTTGLTLTIAAEDDWGVYTDVPAGSYDVCFGAVAGYNPPSCQDTTVAAGSTTLVAGDYTASSGATGQSGVGLLRVTTSPALPSQISVDGNVADTWGLNWLEIATGTHTVCFSALQGYTAPPCQTVTVTADETTTVTGNFTQRGFLQLQTTPPVAGTVYINGVPGDDWGVYTDLPPATYTLCFGAVPSYTAPSCQAATITAGSTTEVIANY